MQAEENKDATAFWDTPTFRADKEERDEATTATELAMRLEENQKPEESQESIKCFKKDGVN